MSTDYLAIDGMEITRDQKREIQYWDDARYNVVSVAGKRFKLSLQRALVLQFL